MNEQSRPASNPSHLDPQAALVAFLKGRSAPCPRCAYDLRDIQTANCPECGEPLVLMVGSPNARFGWLVLAIAPGCFSGVAAIFVLIPVCIHLLNPSPAANGVWALIAADAFGFASAASIVLMYRARHRIMGWPSRRQAAFAAAVWAVHVLALALLILGMRYL
ncbi:MAG: hypothetical protein SFY69_13870 [Planctomycetota bacterium]|nr:hypothetical protein [Planctomycetota bacterium]